MSNSIIAPVLIIGGSGSVGKNMVEILRKLHPELPIAIGGRNLKKAQQVADTLGNATAITVDVGLADLGLTGNTTYSAVALFAKDSGLNGLRYAQKHGIPYMSLSSTAFEIAPEIGSYIHNSKRSAILLASHWLAGTATLPTLHFAKQYKKIDSLELAFVMDEQEPAGPEAALDFERLAGVTTSAQILDNGVWRWVDGEEAVRRFTSVDGLEIQASAFANMDTIALAAATTANSIRCVLEVGESSGRRNGKPFSSDIIIEISGQNHEGNPQSDRYELLYDGGITPQTALGAVLGLEGLLGLAGRPAAEPGLYFPEMLVEPTRMIEQLEKLGTVIKHKTI